MGTELIPRPDSIPAPFWVFNVLAIVLFALHIMVINVALGGSLLLFFRSLFSSDADRWVPIHERIARKIPTSFALGVNLGVAPLLFMQVIYGHYFYTSSVLMGTFWILVIPLLIIAYYGAYIHVTQYKKNRGWSFFSMGLSLVILLYIGFIFVNNMTLMLHPEQWNEYFSQRNGLMLNLSDRTLWPRYLHFLVASVAIGSLFISVVLGIRKSRGGTVSEGEIKRGLKIFAISTILQIIVGFWFLLTVPSDFIPQFMGQNLFYTLVFMLGLVMALGAVVAGFLGKLIPTVIHAVLTVVIMAIMRANLRALYLNPHFSKESLILEPQIFNLFLFLLILIIGLGTVAYMIKLIVAKKEGRVA